MKNSFTSILLFLLIASATMAQQVHYEVTQNDPYSNVSNFKLRLNMLGMDLNSINILNVNTGIWGEAMIAQRLGLNAAFERSWLTMPVLEKTKGGVFPPTAFHNYELGSSIILADILVTKKVNVVLHTSSSTSTSSSGSTTTTLTKFVTIPDGKVRKQFGVRSGFISFGAAVQTKTGHFNLDALDASAVPTTQLHKWSHYSTAGLYLGLIKIKTTNLTIKTTEWGTCYNRMSNKLYFDLLLAPFFTASTINGTMPASATDVNLRKVAIKSPLGFRMGIENSPSGNKEGGMTVKAEIGYRPGIGAWFLNLGLGLNLANRRIAALDIAKTEESPILK